ncbi:hypothetical protein [Dialister sp. i34-0019-2H8]
MMKKKGFRVRGCGAAHKIMKAPRSLEKRYARNRRMMAMRSIAKFAKRI